MQLTSIERETILSFNQEEKTASVDVCNPKMLKQLNALAQERPEACIKTREDEFGATFTIPKNWIKIRANRILTDEQKAIASERMAKIRQQQKHPK